MFFLGERHFATLRAFPQRKSVVVLLIKSGDLLLRKNDENKFANYTRSETGQIKKQEKEIMEQKDYLTRQGNN
jgi:hypothetical protein